jgi:hypothetical protein
MLKRMKYIDHKLMRYKNWHSDRINILIKKSLLRNYQIQPKIRLSFIIQKDYANTAYKFYKSQNKLQCQMSYSFKVPSKKINFSRFYLTRSVDRLLLFKYQK